MSILKTISSHLKWLSFFFFMIHLWKEYVNDLFWNIYSRNTTTSHFELTRIQKFWTIDASYTFLFMVLYMKPHLKEMFSSEITINTPNEKHFQKMHHVKIKLQIVRFSKSSMCLTECLIYGTKTGKFYSLQVSNQNCY